MVVPVIVDCNREVGGIVIKLTMVCWEVWLSIPPVRMFASLVTSAVALTVVVVTAVTLDPEVEVTVLKLTYGVPIYGLRSSWIAPFWKLLSPSVFPESRTVDATVLVRLMMFEAVVSWNSGVVTLFWPGCLDTGSWGKRS